MEGQKESLSQQLKESLAKLDELSQAQPDLNTTQDVLGKVLAEKFNLEKKVRKKEVTGSFLAYLDNMKGTNESCAASTKDTNDESEN